MKSVKVTKTVVGAIQVGQNPQHVCFTEGVCLVAHVSTGSAVQQQCSSSAADKGWRFVPDAIMSGHRRAPQWVPTRTPTVHWGLNRRRALDGPFGSDSRNTANTQAKRKPLTELFVKGQCTEDREEWQK